jgi:hypothetical protein
MVFNVEICSVWQIREPQATALEEALDGYSVYLVKLLDLYKCALKSQY